MEGVGGAFVLHDQDIWVKVRDIHPAYMAAGVATGREAIVVILAARWCTAIVDYVVVVIFCDSRGRAAGVGERGVTPTTGPEIAAHKEEEGNEWKDPRDCKSCRVSVCDQ